MTNKTSDYIDWESCEKIEQSLLQAKQYRIYAYLVIGKRVALRAKDMLTLTWGDVLDNKFLELTESKTGKARKIPVHEETKKQIKAIYDLLKPNKEEKIFRSRGKKGVMSSQYISKQLRYYSAPIVGWDRHISTHSTRKTFARRVLNQSEDKTRALVMLNDILNHSTLDVTRRYLGIREEEINDIYQNL